MLIFSLCVMFGVFSAASLLLWGFYLLWDKLVPRRTTMRIIRRMTR